MMQKQQELLLSTLRNKHNELTKQLNDLILEQASNVCLHGYVKDDLKARIQALEEQLDVLNQGFLAAMNQE